MESRNKEINSFEENQNPNINNTPKTASVFGDPDDETAADENTAVFSHFKENRLKSFFKGELFTKGFWLIIGIFLFAALVYILSRFITPFAEFWTRYPAQGIRFIMAKLTGWIPFSLAEGIIVSLPILALAYIIGSSVSTKRDSSNKNFYRWLRPLVSFLLAILTIFFAGFGPAYSRNKLAVNLGIQQSDVSSDELFETAKIVSEFTQKELDNIDFDFTGASVLPYDYNTLVEKVNEAFDKYASTVDYISHFNSNPKAISLSEPMTYTHISGVYTFMTGESNINTNYPDFLIPFTMAHEMAHQRGIAREDEANFVAFLVCINSDESYLRYSGYANMENYLLNALYKGSSEKYKTLVSEYLPKELAYEFSAYSEFFDKYRDSVASEVTGTVNNTFLQSQGQEAGTQSYGLVVDLAVAYYK